MRVKSEIWQLFKSELLTLAEVLDDEWNAFEIPIENDNFKIKVGDCEVFPVFTNRDGLMKVDYDLSLCETRLRTLSISTYKDETRMGITLKPNYNSLQSNL
jgi:hypothetical protein